MKNDYKNRTVEGIHMGLKSRCWKNESKGHVWETELVLSLCGA